MSAPARNKDLAGVLDKWKQMAWQEYIVKNRNKFCTDLDRINSKQSTKSVTSTTFNRREAENPPLLGAVDPQSIDLGGLTGKTTAGTGIGLDDDAGENRMDRSLPGSHAKAILSIPRWLGPDCRYVRACETSFFHDLLGWEDDLNEAERTRHPA